MPTTRIPRDFKEFLKLLAAHNARFLLIGGYAVNAFGYVRNTVDMDVCITRMASTTIRRFVQAQSFWENNGDGISLAKSVRSTGGA